MRRLTGLAAGTAAVIFRVAFAGAATAAPPLRVVFLTGFLTAAFFAVDRAAEAAFLVAFRAAFGAGFRSARAAAFLPAADFLVAFFADLVRLDFRAPARFAVAAEVRVRFDGRAAERLVLRAAGLRLAIDVPRSEVGSRLLDREP